ncbi:S-adenosyl-L-methionine-dependent methyltransferase [Gonapodya prolifera JEL478]|uniref:S-adenosyl-L-methionine-dependent methyltransferase n=1 Tax=Gonapodya prolifera (strain JEL478) TaxID=1344416 RepID=A0A139A3M0_GONPJ|nr:S-adenosyl-L-methionine-dependent methyltransferase [Gonapodya prolifera JEL478]|eukprot:KXS11075.1 S-adenosyl-L-methionine-dependent methyltransferase [Gonapodya prolifera JEL478]
MASLINSWLQSTFFLGAAYVVTKHGVPEVVPFEGEGVDVVNLAKETGTKVEELDRLLRALSTFGVFRQTALHHWVHTAQSAPLRKEHPKSIRSLVLHAGAVGIPSLVKLDEFLKEGEDDRAPFERLTGVSLDDWFAQNEITQSNLHKHMTEERLMTPLLTEFDWNKFAGKTIVDLGGGNGEDLEEILSEYPSIANGIVLDRPSVIALAQSPTNPASQNHRLTFLAGDFNRPLHPSLSSPDTVFFLKHILHDRSDAGAVRVLHNIRQAIPAGTTTGGALLVVDAVVDPANPGINVAQVDMWSMSQFGAKERTKEQWEALLDKGGFKLEEVREIHALSSLLVAKLK